MDATSAAQAIFANEDSITQQPESIKPGDAGSAADGRALSVEKAEALRYAAFETLIGVGDDTSYELTRAVEKHGIFQTPFNPEMHPREAFIILAEEVGEVARALTYDEGNTIALYDELIQVAAMASAMAVAVILREEMVDNG